MPRAPEHGVEVKYPSGWKPLYPFPLTILEANWKRRRVADHLLRMKRNGGVILAESVRITGGPRLWK